MQDIWGEATSLQGQLATVCMFTEALAQSSIKTLHEEGKLTVNHLNLFSARKNIIELFFF